MSTTVGDVYLTTLPTQLKDARPKFVSKISAGLALNANADSDYRFVNAFWLANGAGDLVGHLPHRTLATGLVRRMSAVVVAPWPLARLMANNGSGARRLHRPPPPLNSSAS